MTIENELKYKISNVDRLKNILKNSGFSTKNKIYQIDYYFSPPHKNFVGTYKYYLRLRKIKDKGIFAYHVVVNNLQTRELEVGINNFKDFINILKLLDFKLDCIVRKNRITYTRENIKIVIDNVKNLGNFLEIEYCGVFSERIRQEFRLLKKKLNLNKKDLIEGVGYPDLLLKG